LSRNIDPRQQQKGIPASVAVKRVLRNITREVATVKKACAEMQLVYTDFTMLK